jgi:hypothetical protein
VSFWCALTFAGVEVFPAGIIKGLVLRHLRWWFQLPIFSESGLLTVGYGYPNMLMAENYNAPGSPYWALKSFLPLAFPESAPFWTANEEPLPELAPVCEQPHPGMILCRNRETANVVALCGGQQPTFPRHAAEKYSKFAYSTVFAFNVPTEPLNLTCRGHDSMLALSEDGVHWRVRSAVTGRRIEAGMASSVFEPWQDVRITTWLIPHGAWHLRIHHVTTGRLLQSAEGGFAICYSDEAKGSQGAAWKSGPGAAFIPEGEFFSGIRDAGMLREGENILADPNANLLLPGTAIPTLRQELEPGEHWLGAAVLGGRGAGGKELWERGNSWKSTAEEIAGAFGLPWSAERAGAWVAKTFGGA